MRGTERALADERGVSLQFAGNGMDLGCFETFAEGEGRKDGGKAFCHHGLAASGAAHEDDVVTTCRCHLKGSFHVLLPFHFVEVVGEGEHLRIEFFTGIDHCGFECAHATEKRHNVVQMAHSIHFQSVHHRCFTGIFGRDEECFVAQFSCLDGDGQDSLDGEDGSIKPQFANKHEAFGAFYLEKSAGEHHADGHRQVETRTFLAHIGRGKIDHHRLVGHLVAIHAEC